MAAQLVQLAGRVEPAGAGGVHDVEGAAAADGDDGHARGHRLLQRLAEGVGLAGVHEQVQARHVAREVLAPLEAGEVRAGQLPLELFAQRPGADDHEAGARQVREHPQVPDLLLVRQPPHEAHELLAVRGELGAQRLVPLGGMESAGVDAAAPQVHASHPLAVQLPDGERRRRERQRGHVVQARHVAPQDVLQPRGAVPGRVAGDLGLVDGHGGDAELLGRLHRAPAQHEGGGDVHHVRGEVGEHAAQPAHRAGGHPHGGVPGQGHGGQGAHGEALDLAGGLTGARALGPPGGPRGGRGDHHRLVAPFPQVPQHLEDGVGDPVHVGQERFGDHDDTHVADAKDPGPRPGHPPTTAR